MLNYSELPNIPYLAQIAEAELYKQYGGANSFSEIFGKHFDRAGKDCVKRVYPDMTVLGCFQQVFSDTAGLYGGVGGQQFTGYHITILQEQTSGMCFVFQSNGLVYKVGGGYGEHSDRQANRQFFKDITDNNMNLKSGAHRYEMPLKESENKGE
jgi:hypothetical protein